MTTAYAEKKTPPEAPGGFQRTFDQSKVSTTIYQRKGKNQERFREERAEKYRNALNSLPQRGGGLHSALMSVCNLGVSAGIPEQDLFNEITATGRRFKPGEVAEAIAKAESDTGKRTGFKPHEKTSGEEIFERLAKDKEKASALQKKLIQQGGEIDPFGADVWECSNPRPECFPRSGGLEGSECCADMLLFLRELYRSEDLLYIGSGFEKTAQQPEHIKTVSAWIEFFSAELEAIRTEENEREQFYKIASLADHFPFFIVNPLSGTPQETGSFRSDANVSSFRYIVVESDTLPLDKQVSLLNGLKLPVVSMTFSGRKSIHALLDASALNGGTPVKNHSEWQHVVKENLFGQIVPLGFDPQTSNPARLSRLPGIWRQDKDQFQKLLYINRKGGALCLTK